jgi:hypothetical protein
MANLVWDNLDNIIPLGTSQGQRIRRIVDLAQPAWIPSAWKSSHCFLNKATNAFHFQSTQKVVRWTVQRICQTGRNLIWIAPGADLAAPMVPGSPVFCEALEYTLLGSVAEAESKRFRNQTDYFRNAHVDQFSAPVITGVGEQGQDLAIEHNEAQHRFCFVEKTELTTSQECGAGPGKTD